MGALYDEYEQYVKIYQEEYGPHTVVLYRCGSFYEIYSIDNDSINLKEISELLNIQISRRNKSILQVDRINCNMAGFPMFALKKFVDILINNSYTVVIVDQVSDPPKPKRAVTEIISPGTQIDNINSFDSNILLVAVFEEHDVWKRTEKLMSIGLALIDLTTGKSKVTEFNSNTQDPNLAIDELFKVISFYLPREIVLTSHNNLVLYDYDYLVSYLEISKACVHNKLSKYLPVMTKIPYQEQLLRKIFPNHGLLNVFEYLDLERRPIATLGFVYMLDFCHKHNENIIQNIIPPEILFLNNNSLLLSYNTCKQLNINELVNILNNCSTAIGRRAFKERLLTPMIDANLIKASYEKIAIFCDFYKDTAAQLNNIYDLERLFRKLTLKRLHPADISQIYTTFEAIIKLHDIINFDKIDLIHSFLDKIRLTINLDEINKYHLDNISISFFMKDIYPEIDKLQEKYDKVKSIFELVSNNIHKEFTKVDYNERDGYFINITNKRYNDLKKTLKNFKVYDIEFNINDFIVKPISSSSSNLKITSEYLKKTNTELSDLKDILSKTILTTYIDFITELDDSFRQYYTDIIKYIIDIDWYTSCAKNTIQYNYKCPILEEKPRSYVKIKALRHPIIERLLTFQDYIPNDIELGTDETQCILLYGLNGSGKSITSKSIALTIIMAQAGMYVPCEEFTYWPYHEIFTRVPSGDDMMKGQSTFVVEISELRNILKRATANSLVIGDELASGTESVSALAIVSAGILQLYKKQSSFIFATHLHDLTSISKIKDLEYLKIYHLSVTYDHDSDKLIYDRKLKHGQGNTLYGLEVCKSLNLGHEFLELANTIRQEVLEINSNIHNTKQSKYNSQYYMDICNICGKKADEVHHIIQQSLADENDFISYKHKNALSNLMGVCEKCHDEIHRGNLIIDGYRQTSNGIELVVSKPSHKKKSTPKLSKKKI
jgi:DNA mismatch repair protein MutS